MDDFWNDLASSEEHDRDDERMNRALRWRVVERHLAGVRTILDLGGGTGAFSIPLARRGYAVTHVDGSTAMLARARERAAGLPIAFRHGSALDDHGAFDLVLCFDGPISFAGPAAGEVLAAAAAATTKTLLVTVSSHAAMAATWIKYSLAAKGTIVPAAEEMLRTGLWSKDRTPEDAALFPSPYKMPRLKAFTRAELATALERTGLRVVETRAIGSLTHLMLPHGHSVDAYEDLCDEYDRLFPDGPGSFRRAGLLGVATR